MADEPTNGELGRGLDRITEMLTNLIGRAEYTAHQQGIERRFADQGADIQDLRRQHEADVEKLHQRINGHEKAHKADHQAWRLIIYTIVIPALVVLIDHFATLLIGGGK